MIIPTIPCLVVVGCMRHNTFDKDKSSTYSADGRPVHVKYGSGFINGYLGLLMNYFTGMNHLTATCSAKDRLHFGEHSIDNTHFINVNEERGPAFDVTTLIVCSTTLSCMFSRRKATLQESLDWLFPRSLLMESFPHLID